MTKVSEPKLPPNCAWLSLMEALSWATWEYSVSLDEADDGALDDFEPDGTALRQVLESTWQKLADDGAIGCIAIRGKRDGDNWERDLSVDDLRNCRHLAWNRLGNTSKCGWIGDGNLDRKVLRAERHPDTYSGAWDRLEDQGCGYDYYDVVVRRSELMQLHPITRQSIRKLKSVVADKRRALEWLERLMDRNEPKSVRKEDLISHLRKEFHLPKTRAREVWDKATETRLDWRLPGCPKKGVRLKILPK